MKNVNLNANRVKESNSAAKNTYTAIIYLILLIMASADSYAVSDALKIKISKGSYSDETIIRFMQGATANFDGSYDAWKLFSTHNYVPNIMTKTGFGEALAINTLPSLTTTYSIDLSLRIGGTATYTFSSAEVGGFAPGVCIMLFDRKTGNIYNLRDTSTTFRITMPVMSENDAARFSVVFSLPASAQTTGPGCLGCKNGEVRVTKPGWSNWEYAIMDSAGNVLESGTSPDESIVLNGLSSGDYAAVVGSQFFTCRDSILFHINEFKTMGINNYFNSNECKFSYYDGVFRLETDFKNAKSFSAQIIDAQGNPLWRGDFTDTQQLTINPPLNGENLPAGMYVGIIQGQDFMAVKKVIVSK